MRLSMTDDDLRFGRLVDMCGQTIDVFSGGERNRRELCLACPAPNGMRIQSKAVWYFSLAFTFWALN